jgi:hypothetical protein
MENNKKIGHGIAKFANILGHQHFQFEGLPN